MSDRAQSRPSPVSFSEAFLYWLKLGFISFGGPTGQIAIMHQDLVERKRWISEKRFLHALNYCMLLPGPEATQLATYIGWMMHRTWGGIVAGGLFVLPSVFILIALSWIYMAYGDIVWWSGLFVGGWTRELFGAGALAGAGIAGALVATFITFLPSFVFILVGAPFIETTHG